MNGLLEQLNPAQQLAVTTTEGPVLVLAGPGSGKTRVLTHRVAFLIREKGVRPWQIMAVTFTNKAAREMKARLEQLIGGVDLEQLTIGTFHAICARILRREATALGMDAHFVIYDDDDQKKLVDRVLKELNLDDKQYRPNAMRNLISTAKTNLLTPNDWATGSYVEEVARRVYARYQALLDESNALDFDDLLLRVTLALRQNPDLRQKYQQRYRYVLVDEFQDTNRVQYEMVRQFSGGTGNLFGVGDEDQSIYMFRGADFRNVQRFEQDYPKTNKILLEQNYRSTQVILDAATAVIAPNTQRTHKALFTQRRGGTPIVVHEAYDENQEARWVVEQIVALRHERTSPGECAVMYRTNAQSRAIEDAFVAQGMPYRLVGATRFYDRREIRDLKAYMSIIYNPYSTADLERIINVPSRKIGAKTLADLSRWAAGRGLALYDALGQLPLGAECPVSTAARRALLGFYELWRGWVAQRESASALNLLDQVIAQTGYETYLCDDEGGDERWENVLELRNVAARYDNMPVEESLAAFIQDMDLVSDTDSLDHVEGVSNAPTLLTLHTAKGLEFRVVFIVGVDDGLIPHSRSFDSPDAMEEERRLFYVGITRAQDRLYLSHTFRRTTFGSSDLSAPSRYLKDIPGHGRAASFASKEQTRPRVNLDAARFGAAQPGRRSATADAPFRPGDRVSHKAFGEGVVLSVEPRGSDWDVTVAFKGRGSKTLAAGFAGLDKMD